MQKSWVLLDRVKTAFFIFMILTLLTGVIYPLMMTGFAAVFFNEKANGSLVKHDNQIIGSALIGQYFSDPMYFWGRPSATTPVPYNGAASQASNYGPKNPIFLAEVTKRLAFLKTQHQKDLLGVPVELVTSSGSGLDPHISPYGAFYQSERIAKARNIPRADVNQLIRETMVIRMGGILGEGYVNVLQLNLALDILAAKQNSQSTVSE